MKSLKEGLEDRLLCSFLCAQIFTSSLKEGLEDRLLCAQIFTSSLKEGLEATDFCVHFCVHRYLPAGLKEPERIACH